MAKNSTSNSNPQKKSHTEIEIIFQTFDNNGDGKISASELKSLLHALGSETSTEEVKKMMDEMDKDGDGYVDLTEFSEFHAGSGGNAGSTNELQEAFSLYDKDGNGKISARELYDVLKSLGEKCSLKDCKKMIQSVDADGDGHVDFEEFKKMKVIDHNPNPNPNPLPVGLDPEREPSSIEPSYENDTKRLVHIAANNMKKMICCKVFYMWLIRLFNVILEIIIAFLAQVNANGNISGTKYRKLSVITSSICLIISLVEIMNYRLSQGKLFRELSLYFSVISSTLQFSINLAVLILKKQFIKFDYFSLLFSTVTLLSPITHRQQEPMQEIHDD